MGMTSDALIIILPLGTLLSVLLLFRGGLV
jgi:hypothetical protein